MMMQIAKLIREPRLAASIVISAGLLATGLLLPVGAVAQPAGQPIAPGADGPADGAAAGNTPYQPLSREERVRWFVESTVGLESLGAGVVSAGWGTAFNNPEEYGTHWDGFAKRYGMRLTGIVTSNAIEAGLGSVWGEDPRYAPVGEGGIWSRVRNSAKMTVVAQRADGSIGPAYARYAGIGGSNFLSNTWRVESDSSAGAALRRTGFGFAGRFVGNVFGEFWPDVRRKLFGRK